MSTKALPFDVFRDAANLPFLAVNISAVKRHRLGNATLSMRDRCSFLHESLTPTHLASNKFSTDLTDRDDVVLAVISLLLLLVIEASLSAFLLRTRRDQSLSNFSFSIKHFLDLARDFRFHRLFRSPRSSDQSDPNSKSAPSRRRLNTKLVLTASLVLVVTFGLEVLVLYFSSPTLVPVSTRIASIQLKRVVYPDWLAVRDSIDTSSTLRPCTTVTLENVEQNQTQISACLTSSVTADAVEDFDTVSDPVKLRLVSDLHEFGVEHYLVIGTDNAIFSARAYYSLEDSKTKIMRARIQLHNKQVQMQLVHQQLVAFLFNAYANETKDESMNLQRLQALEFNFAVVAGPKVKILQLNGKERFREVASVSHITEVEGIIPRGEAALVFAQQLFKAAIAIEIVGPDYNDLLMSSGNTQGDETVMWFEDSRPLNWLSLLIIMVLAVSFFTVLRFLFHPVGSAEIAMFSVLGAPDGNFALAEGVRKNFGISSSSSESSGSSDPGSRRRWDHIDGDKLSDDISMELSRGEMTKGTESLRTLPF